MNGFRIAAAAVVGGCAVAGIGAVAEEAAVVVVMELQVRPLF